MGLRERVDIHAEERSKPLSIPVFEIDIPRLATTRTAFLTLEGNHTRRKKLTDDAKSIPASIRQPVLTLI